MRFSDRGREAHDGARSHQGCDGDPAGLRAEACPLGTVPASGPSAPGTARRRAPSWVVALVAALVLPNMVLGTCLLSGCADRVVGIVRRSTARPIDEQGSATRDADDGGGSIAGGMADKGGDPEADTDSDDESYVVRARSFQFSLPEYWRGKVDVMVDGDEARIYPKCCSPLGGQDDVTPLARLELEDGKVAENAGDIGNSLVYSQTLGDSHVEVWATNWPWIITSGSGGVKGPKGRGQLSEFVDLSSGGTLTYMEAMGLGDRDASVSSTTNDYLGGVDWDIKATG